jgi:hypothetical protein
VAGQVQKLESGLAPVAGQVQKLESGLAPIIQWPNYMCQEKIFLFEHFVQVLYNNYID